ncbi:MAG: SUMF1/EgtB/PvdO family nonheme iron enzyme [Planctomycetota bacterium]
MSPDPRPDKPQPSAATPSFDLVPPDAPYESGFGRSTIWASLFIGVVMLPGVIYLGLVTGAADYGASNWVLLILFIEISKRTFVRLRTQEILIMSLLAGALLAYGGKLGTAANLFGGPFGGFIWDQYLIQSPQARGIAKFIPHWAMPPADSEAYVQRTFFHIDYLLPVLVFFFTSLFQRAAQLASGYVLFRITSDVERLPFPLAPVGVAGATALAETSQQKEGWRWRVFSTTAMIGIVWGFLYVGVPTITGILFLSPVQIIPIPFVDFTQTLQNILPASPVAIGTSILFLSAGFIIPFHVSLGIFVGTLTMVLVGYPLLHKLGYLYTWTKGMSYIPALTCNSLDFGIAFGAGVALVVAGIGIGRAARELTRLRVAARDPAGAGLPAGRGDIALPVAVLFWALATIAQVFLVKLLVPTFPMWISALFGFVWTPVFSYVNARMFGITGGAGTVSLPYVREASFLLSGYEGVALWFAPVPQADYGSQAVPFKQLELSRTRFGSYIKMSVLAFVLFWVMSFVHWSFVWRLGPIPSELYPYCQKIWPLNATFQSMWARSTMPDREGRRHLEPDITNAQWRRFLDETGYKWTPAYRCRAYRAWMDLPAAGLTYDDLSAYARWARSSAPSQSDYARAQAGLDDANYLWTETSPAEWRRFADETGLPLPKYWPAPDRETAYLADDLLPVPGVSYDDVVAFYRWAGQTPPPESLWARPDEPEVPLIWKILRPRNLALGFCVAAVLYAALAFAGVPIALFYGIITGLVASCDYAFLQFAGALLGHFYIRRKLGDVKWRAYAPVVMAGLGCGIGLVSLVAIAIALIAKSVTTGVL